MRRPTILKIRAHPYSYVVYVCFSYNAQGRRWMKHRAKWDTDVADAEGLTHVDDDNNTVYCWIHRDVTQSTLVHELTHAATHILSGSGVPVNVTNDEALAYLIEYLFSAVTKKRARADHEWADRVFGKIEYY